MPDFRTTASCVLVPTSLCWRRCHSSPHPVSRQSTGDSEHEPSALPSSACLSSAPKRGSHSQCSVRSRAGVRGRAPRKASSLPTSLRQRDASHALAQTTSAKSAASSDPGPSGVSGCKSLNPLGLHPKARVSLHLLHSRFAVPSA